MNEYRARVRALAQFVALIVFVVGVLIPATGNARRMSTTVSADGNTETRAYLHAGPTELANPLCARDSPLAAGGGVEATRVGRWMSEAELETMVKTGRVQEGAGGLTFGSVKGPGDFAKQAKPGSVYVEYDVPTNSLLPGGKEGWVKTVGPNAAKSQQFKLGKQGGEVLPPAQNISPVLQRK